VAGITLWWERETSVAATGSGGIYVCGRCRDGPCDVKHYTNVIICADSGALRAPPGVAMKTNANYSIRVDGNVAVRPRRYFTHHQKQCTPYNGFCSGYINSISKIRLTGDNHEDTDWVPPIFHDRILTKKQSKSWLSSQDVSSSRHNRHSDLADQRVSVNMIVCSRTISDDFAAGLFPSGRTRHIFQRRPDVRRNTITVVSESSFAKACIYKTDPLKLDTVIIRPVPE